MTASSGSCENDEFDNTNWSNSDDVSSLKNRTIREAVEVRDQAIEKELEFEGCEFESPFIFINCVFRKSVVIRECWFSQQIVFYNCHFEQGLVIRDTRIDSDAILNFSVSARLTVFDGVTVRRAFRLNNFDARAGLLLLSCRFRGFSDWIAMTVCRSIACANSRFYSGIDASNCSLNGRLALSSSVFSSRVDFSGSTFELVDIERCRFLGEVIFKGSSIARILSVSESKVRSEANFSLVAVGSYLSLKNISVAGDANFSASEFCRVADFSGSTFHKNVLFDGCKFGNSAMFSGTRFLGTANFVYSVFDGGADFSGSEFQDKAHFEFVRVKKSMMLHQARFAGLLDLMFARIDNLVIPKVNEIVLNKLRMRGLSYERLETDSWEEFMAKRQDVDFEAYAQLEKSFLRQGDVKTANTVHYQMGCGKLRAAKWWPPFRKIGYIIWKYVSGFGVSLLRLICANLLILFLTFLLFCAPRALDQKDLVHSPLLVSQAIPSLGDIAVYSLRTFLPAPLTGSQKWSPTDEVLLGLEFGTWAVLSSLLGWILVPAMIAGLVRLLRRESGAS